MTTLRVGNIEALGGAGTITVPTGNQIAQVDNPSGLVFLRSQTIGTAVSSVTVSNAFSADFDNYRIVVTGTTASAGGELRCVLGSSTSGYYGNLIFCRPNAGGVVGGVSNNNIANWQYFGIVGVNGSSMTADIYSPFLALRTSIYSQVTEFTVTGANGSYIGWHDSAVSYSSFTLSTVVGTITGGSIRIYGYRN